MSRPVFSFRPTLDDPEHKRAWEILQSVPNGQKNAFLVQTILQSADSENLIEKIRMVFREELKEVQISPEKVRGNRKMRFRHKCWIFFPAWKMFQNEQ